MEQLKQNRLNPSLLTFKQVQGLTGLSRSTIYRQIKRGKFPRPRLLAVRKVGFIRGELENWIENREVA